jgi:hypothetical protein
MCGFRYKWGLFSGEFDVGSMGDDVPLVAPDVESAGEEAPGVAATPVVENCTPTPLPALLQLLVVLSVLLPPCPAPPLAPTAFLSSLLLPPPPPKPVREAMALDGWSTRLSRLLIA